MGNGSGPLNKPLSQLCALLNSLPANYSYHTETVICTENTTFKLPAIWTCAWTVYCWSSCCWIFHHFISILIIILSDWLDAPSVNIHQHHFIVYWWADDLILQIFKAQLNYFSLTRKPRKGAAVIAASMKGFASCRKFKSPVTLTLTLDRVKATSTYTVYVGLPAYPTMWLYITQYRNMWPFECREISTFREVWTLVIPFLEGNSKIGLREAVDQVLYCQYQPSVLSSTRKWRRRYTWKCTFMGNCRKFKWSVTLTVDRVKVIPTYTVHVVLPVGPTTWL